MNETYKGGSESPRTSWWRWKRVEERGFVKMSDSISSVGIHVVENDLGWTWSRIKWWWISICFERAEIAEEVEREQAAWLSVRMGLALEGHREAWHVQVLLLFYSLQLGIWLEPKIKKILMPVFHDWYHISETCILICEVPSSFRARKSSVSQEKVNKRPWLSTKTRKHWV